MKLTEKDYAVMQPGTIKITPQEADDLWVVYNLIKPGDIVTSDTTGKIRLENTAKNTVTRVNITLSLKIMSLDLDKSSFSLRLKGRNTESNQFAAAATFHTITLKPHRSFVLYKKKWDSAAIAALTDSSLKPSAADLAVVLLRENADLAEIFLVGERATTVSSKIEKKSGRGSHNNHVFFQEVYTAFVKRVDFNSVKSVVIAGGGPMKDEFRRFLLSEAKRLKVKSIEDNKSRIVVAGSKSEELKEILNDKRVMSMIKDSKVVLEIRALKELMEHIEGNTGRACYGAKNVEGALEMMAIDTLLITDELYRNGDVKTRLRHTTLVKAVKEKGGNVLIYTSMHVSAKQLADLTGVAALLRFPLPHLDDLIDL